MVRTSRITSRHLFLARALPPHPPWACRAAGQSSKSPGTSSRFMGAFPGDYPPAAARRRETRLAPRKKRQMSRKPRCGE